MSSQGETIKEFQLPNKTRISSFLRNCIVRNLILNFLRTSLVSNIRQNDLDSEDYQFNQSQKQHNRQINIFHEAFFPLKNRLFFRLRLYVDESSQWLFVCIVLCNLCLCGSWLREQFNFSSVGVCSYLSRLRTRLELTDCFTEESSNKTNFVSEAPDYWRCWLTSEASVQSQYKPRLCIITY